MNEVSVLKIAGTIIEFVGLVCAGLATEPFEGVRHRLETWLRSIAAFMRSLPAVLTHRRAFGAGMSLVAYSVLWRSLSAPGPNDAPAFYREPVFMSLVALAILCVGVSLIGRRLGNALGSIEETNIQSGFAIAGLILGGGILMQLAGEVADIST